MSVLLRVCARPSRVISPLKQWPSPRFGLNGLPRLFAATSQATPSESAQLRFPRTDLNVDDVVHGFRVKSVAFSQDYGIKTFQLEHEASGAKYLHLACPDQENTFFVSFPTCPQDSTGVAHILEHTVLCGSELYPVRDPFFSMYTRTLCTFMNAFTAPDWTMYPFATTHQKDFYNLMSVMLDAAFFPRLNKLSFAQEGHRLQFTDPADSSTPLEIAGIVYNEMKNANADQWSVIRHTLNEEFWPTITYRVNSGGDTQAMPDLTYDQFKEFHRDHYHASNAYFYSYGDMPLESHLKHVDEHVLSRFEANPDKAVSVPDEQRFTSPKRISATYPPPTDEDNSRQVFVKTLCNNVTDHYESFAMSVLYFLLSHGPNAPLFQALIVPGLCADFAALAGYSAAYTREATLTIAASQVEPENVETVLETIDAVMKQCTVDGFPQDRIDAVIHLVELNARTPSDNFGLHTGLALVGQFIHGGDAAASLNTTEMVDRLRADVAKGGFFEGLIQKWFIDNTHKLTAVFEPDADFHKGLLQAEQKKLATLSASVVNDEAKIQDILDASAALDEDRARKDDTSCLPTLRLSDVSRSVQNHFPLTKDHSDRTGAFSSVPESTNGLVRVVLGFQSHHLPADLVPYFSLYRSVVTSLGTSTRDHRELSQAIEMTMSGVGANRVAQRVTGSLDTYTDELYISTTCLARNSEAAVSLLGEILGDSVLSQDRLLDDTRTHFVAQLRAMIHQEITDWSSAGRGAAMQLANRGISALGADSYARNGLPHLRHIQALEQLNLDDADVVEGVVDKLRAIHAIVMAENAGPRSLVIAERGVVGDVNRSLSRTLDQWNLGGAAGERPIQGENFTQDSGRQTFVSVPNAQTFGVARILRTVPFTHEDVGALEILAHIMQTGFLHKEIRERGGAYGGGAQGGVGGFTYWSHADPQSLQTLDIFNESATWAQSGKFTDTDIEEAKLSIMKSRDGPVLPLDQGYGQFVAGIPLEDKQTARERILDCSRGHLNQVTEKYLLNPEITTGTAVFGPAEKLDEFKQNAPDGWEYDSII